MCLIKDWIQSAIKRIFMLKKKITCVFRIKCHFAFVAYTHIVVALHSHEQGVTFRLRLMRS